MKTIFVVFFFSFGHFYNVFTYNKAAVKARYPTVNYPDNPLEGDFQLFAFPSGVKLTTKARPSTFHTFVQTKQDGTKLYGYLFIHPF
jgi:hypothetical protein